MLHKDVKVSFQDLYNPEDTLIRHIELRQYRKPEFYPYSGLHKGYYCMDIFIDQNGIPRFSSHIMDRENQQHPSEPHNYKPDAEDLEVLRKVLDGTI